MDENINIEEEHFTYTQVVQKLGISISTIYNLRRSGLFPDPIHMGKRKLLWKKDTIQQYLLTGTKLPRVAVKDN